MGVTKTTIKEGHGEQPVKGDTVTIEYTGWLKDASKPDSKGKQCASPLAAPPARPLAGSCRGTR